MHIQDVEILFSINAHENSPKQEKAKQTNNFSVTNHKYPLVKQWLTSNKK